MMQSDILIIFTARCRSIRNAVVTKYDSASIWPSFDARSTTVRPRSLRTQRGNTLAAVTLTHLSI